MSQDAKSVQTELGWMNLASHDPNACAADLRIESLGPWMPMPKRGDPFFWATCDTRTGEWRVVEDSFKWPVDRLFYWQGLVHPTRESAEEWINRYGAAWLEGNDGQVVHRGGGS